MKKVIVNSEAPKGVDDSTDIESTMTCIYQFTTVSATTIHSLITRWCQSEATIQSSKLASGAV